MVVKKISTAEEDVLVAASDLYHRAIDSGAAQVLVIDGGGVLGACTKEIYDGRVAKAALDGEVFE